MADIPAGCNCHTTPYLPTLQRCRSALHPRRDLRAPLPPPSAESGDEDEGSGGGDDDEDEDQEDEEKGDDNDNEDEDEEDKEEQDEQMELVEATAGPRDPRRRMCSGLPWRLRRTRRPRSCTSAS